VSGYGESKGKIAHIKCANFNLKALAIHSDWSRLYIAMAEPILFCFDITDIQPVVTHSVTLLTPITRMNIDL